MSQWHLVWLMIWSWGWQPAQESISRADSTTQAAVRRISSGRIEEVESPETPLHLLSTYQTYSNPPQSEAGCMEIHIIPLQADVNDDRTSCKIFTSVWPILQLSEWCQSWWFHFKILGLAFSASVQAMWPSWQSISLYLLARDFPSYAENHSVDSASITVLNQSRGVEAACYQYWMSQRFLRFGITAAYSTSQKLVSTITRNP